MGWRTKFQIWFECGPRPLLPIEVATINKIVELFNAGRRELCEHLRQDVYQLDNPPELTCRISLDSYTTDSKVLVVTQAWSGQVYFRLVFEWEDKAMVINPTSGLPRTASQFVTRGRNWAGVNLFFWDCMFVREMVRFPGATV